MLNSPLYALLDAIYTFGHRLWTHFLGPGQGRSRVDTLFIVYNLAKTTIYSLYGKPPPNASRITVTPFLSTNNESGMRPIPSKVRLEGALCLAIFVRVSYFFNLSQSDTLISPLIFKFTVSFYFYLAFLKATGQLSAKGVVTEDFPLF